MNQRDVYHSIDLIERQGNQGTCRYSVGGAIYWFDSEFGSKLSGGLGPDNFSIRAVRTPANMETRDANDP